MTSLGTPKSEWASFDFHLCKWGSFDLCDSTLLARGNACSGATHRAAQPLIYLTARSASREAGCSLMHPASCSFAAKLRRLYSQTHSTLIKSETTKTNSNY